MGFGVTLSSSELALTMQRMRIQTREAKRRACSGNQRTELFRPSEPIAWAALSARAGAV